MNARGECSNAHRTHQWQSLGLPHPPGLRTTIALTTGKRDNRSKSFSFLLTSVAHILCKIGPLSLLVSKLRHLSHPLQTTIHQQDSSESCPRHQDLNLLRNSYSCLLNLYRSPHPSRWSPIHSHSSHLFTQQALQS